MGCVAGARKPQCFLIPHTSSRRPGRAEDHGTSPCHGSLRIVRLVTQWVAPCRAKAARFLITSEVTMNDFCHIHYWSHIHRGRYKQHTKVLNTGGVVHVGPSLKRSYLSLHFTSNNSDNFTCKVYSPSLQDTAPFPSQNRVSFYIGLSVLVIYCCTTERSKTVTLAAILLL